LVIDASVAIKWVIEEEGSAAARQLLAEEILVAPDLLFIECANVLWANARRNRISPAEARVAMRAIEGVPLRAVPAHLHASAAQAIAFELDQSAYDSLYLAVALAERAMLVTADERFSHAALEHPVYRSAVRPLKSQ
jgi:predicted nucleic acid-binding protein